MAVSTYPVRMDAHMDPVLNRWLWLVKWLLVIPHYIVLAFLWVAFFVLSVVAFFAILFTGHYPRSIFDFNVGVLRWTWRVAYYAYGALGTDHYPPFTLAEVPDYPTHLEVGYPEHLSRGLVLVKWWLLALPHYAVVGFLAGSGFWLSLDGGTPSDNSIWMWSSGLIGLLVFVGAVVLLFTGRYPQQLFDLVLGLNRWVLRVAAYAALMTDVYPPFRLDMGTDEPGAGGPATLTVPPHSGPPMAAGAPPAGPSAPQSGPVPPQAGPAAPGTGVVPEQPGAQQPGQTGPPQVGPVPPAGPPSVTGGTGPGATPPEAAPGSGTGWGVGRVIVVVLGALIMMASFGLGAGGVALGVAGATLRDDAGFLMSGHTSLATSTHALVTPSAEVRVSGVPEGVLGDVKIVVDPRTAAPVFVGLARTADAQRYLGGVGYATITDLNGIGADPVYRVVPGGAPATPPGRAGIWVARSSGVGERTLTWSPRSGDWTVVVMNATGRSGVAVDAKVGAELPVLGWVVTGLLLGGLLGAVIALALLYLGLHRPKTDAAGPSGSGPTDAGSTDAGSIVTTTYPERSDPS